MILPNLSGQSDVGKSLVPTKKGNLSKEVPFKTYRIVAG